ncbi:hypothetical protein FTP56_21180 [Salmonella enterica]|nr:hypothetical protein [Salmonella enterica]
MKKILFDLMGLQFSAGEHADYLRDIQVTMQKANSGTEVFNVLEFVQDDGQWRCPCSLWVCEGLRQYGPFCAISV